MKAAADGERLPRTAASCGATAFPSATTSHVQRARAGAENAERTCKLRIVSDGLLGTTRFAFDRR